MNKAPDTRTHISESDMPLHRPNLPSVDAATDSSLLQFTSEPPLDDAAAERLTGVCDNPPRQRAV